MREAVTISGLRGRLAAESPILGVQNCGASTRKRTASSTLCLLHNFERPKLDNYFSAARRPEMTPLDLTFDCSKLKSFKKIAVALWRSVRSDSPPGWHSSCKPALRLTKSKNSNGIVHPAQKPARAICFEIERSIQTTKYPTAPGSGRIASQGKSKECLVAEREPLDIWLFRSQTQIPGHAKNQESSALAGPDSRHKQLLLH